MIEKLKAYKKAWEMFDDFLVNKTAYPQLYMGVYCDPIAIVGYLYRFLDEKGIKICERSPYECWWVWANKGTGLDLMMLEKVAEYETQEAAFIKGFEILEERTNG